MIKAEIVKDSRTPSGSRLTTFILTYPRFIHAEFMTHRGFSRNAASSRAIPIEKQFETLTREALNKTSAGPVQWGRNQRGMQAHELLNQDEALVAERLWINARTDAIFWAEQLMKRGVHKQIVNRVLEPYSHITVIATCESKALKNFFALRANPQAQPEFQVLAYAMLKQYVQSQPTTLEIGQWHIPFVDEDEVKTFRLEDLLKIATGRIARISYMNHNGVRSVIDDIELHDKLERSGHWSPFEHCACANETPYEFSNFGRSWYQYRKCFENECVSCSPATLLENIPAWVKQLID